MSRAMGGMPMSEPELRVWETNGIRLRVAEVGEGPSVVLLHGWPELWYSWRHQIPALAGAGYRVLAPDMRGYGGSDAPNDPAEYDVHHIGADIVGLLDAAGIDEAVVVGHDWGSIIAWQLALLHADRVRAVCGMSVPYTGRAPVPPTEGFRARTGENFFYILYFQEPDVAEAEFSSDPRGFLQRIYAGQESGGLGLLGGGPPRAPGWLKEMPAPLPLPDWLSQEELDYYVTEFERTGFRGGINYYRNFDHNWETTPELTDARIEQPALFIAGESDGVIATFDEAARARMREVVPDLRGVVFVPGAGHWVQQERASEVNEALIGWLADIDT
jgi:pimeloyl-ACP methyl ester carboxylesterase